MPFRFCDAYRIEAWQLSDDLRQRWSTMAVRHLRFRRLWKNGMLFCGRQLLPLNRQKSVMKDREVIPCVVFNMSWCILNGRRTYRPSVTKFKYLVSPKFDPGTVGLIQFEGSSQHPLRHRATARVLLSVPHLRQRNFGQHPLLRGQ